MFDASSDLVLAKMQLADAAKELEKSANDLEETRTQLKCKAAESDSKSDLTSKKEMDLETKSNELLAAQERISALEARVEIKRIRQLETDLELTKAELEIARRGSIKESLDIGNAVPSTLIRSGVVELQATPPARSGDEGKSPSLDWSTPSTSVYKISISGEAGYRPSSTSNFISQRSPTPTRTTSLRAPTPPLVEADTTTKEGSPAQFFLAMHGRSSPMKTKGQSSAASYSVQPPPALIKSTDDGQDRPVTKRSDFPGAVYALHECCP